MQSKFLALASALFVTATAMADPPRPYLFPVIGMGDEVPTGLQAWSHSKDGDILIFIEAVTEDVKDEAFHKECTQNVPWKNQQEKPDYCYRGVFVAMKNGKDVVNTIRTAPLYYDWDHFHVQGHGPNLPYTNSGNLAGVLQTMYTFKAQKVQWNSRTPKVRTWSELVLDVGFTDDIPAREFVAGGDAKKCLDAAKPTASFSWGVDQDVALVRLTPGACAAACKKHACRFTSSGTITGDNALYRIVNAGMDGHADDEEEP